MRVFGWLRRALREWLFEHRAMVIQLQDGSVVRTRTPLVLYVSADPEGRDRPAKWFPVPRLYRPSHRVWLYDAIAYAPIGLHWIVRAWHCRWHLLDPLIRAGIWYVPEGDFYQNGRLRWDFWRARRELRRAWGGPS